MNYNVRYVPLITTSHPIGIGSLPAKFSMLARDDNAQALTPSVSGELKKADGSLWSDGRLYYSLTPASMTYDGLQMINGAFCFANNADGGRLWLAESGLAVFYNFPGSNVSLEFQHDVDFSGPATIVYKTSPGAVVKYFIDTGSYYPYQAGRDGVFRFHASSDLSPVKLDDSVYVWDGSAWSPK